MQPRKKIGGGGRFVPPRDWVVTKNPVMSRLPARLNYSLVGRFLKKSSFKGRGFVRLKSTYAEGGFAETVQTCTRGGRGVKIDEIFRTY